MAKSRKESSTVVFTGCIFVDVPAACCWWRNGDCVARTNIRSQLIDCATNHRHIIIRDEAKPLLRELWEVLIGDSGRYKKIQGQEGREESFKMRDKLVDYGSNIDG